MKSTSQKNERTMTELIAAIRGGDEQAFTELYERTNQEVYRTAKAILRSEDLALDVQQDSYVFAYKHLDQLAEPEKVRSWLRTIAVNRARSILRKQTPVLFTELENEDGEGLPEQADLSPEASPELSLERKETAQLVNEILDGLSAGQRAAVGMYYYEQMPVSEIAASLGVSASTVKNQLARGRKKIEEAVHALEKRGVKLYGLSPIPFLLALMKRQSLPAQRSETVLAKTLTKAGIAAGTKAAASAAAPVVLQATKPFFSTVLGKIVLGVAAAGVVVGGAAGYRWAKENVFEKTNPILYAESNEDLQSDPTAPTIPVVIDTTGEVELNTTEPTLPDVPVTRDDTAENLKTTEVTLPVEIETTAPAVPETTADTGEDNQKLWGTCGEDLQWTLNKNSGKLVLTGSGAMTDYPDAQSVPWSDYQGRIKELELPAALTEIGDYAFAGCTALSPDSITLGGTDGRRKLPTGLTRIGAYAFSGCAAMDLSWYKDWFPLSLTTIGDGAFSGCTGLVQVILPENVSTLGSGVFSNCSDLSQLWILNESCAISDLGAQMMICGFPGSTAEQYASDHAFDFNPIVDNQEGVSEQLRRERELNAHFTRMDALIQVGDRYLAKLVSSEMATASEDEIQQAKQSGTLILYDQEFPYTESKTQAKIWGYVYDASEETPGWTGWIQANRSVYTVIQRDGAYVFMKNQQHSDGDPYLKLDEVEIGWIWLDADTMADYSRLDDYLKDSGMLSICLNLYLEQDDEGEISLVRISDGKK